jgi:nucleoside-diphosphate-sugar epimerase
MKKIVVLGGGGFIGGHLAKKLKEQGNHVRVCDLKKQITDLEKEQSETDKSIKDKELEIGPNPTMKDSLMDDIKGKNSFYTCIITIDRKGYTLIHE